MVFLVLNKPNIQRFYTNKPKVKVVLEQAWYVFVIFVFFDCMQAVASGIISGLGLMNRVKFATIFAYIIVGIPISLSLMFTYGLGVEGLWYGPSLSCIIIYGIY
mmetsp:Transcript_2011/g.3559  ORF Transcript_2011/g.3559 Transcript_2011/m.3559 type:complete len:104 (-) Transcript_2011:135-446(-)